MSLLHHQWVQTPIWDFDTTLGFQPKVLQAIEEGFRQKYEEFKRLYNNQLTFESFQKAAFILNGLAKVALVGFLHLKRSELSPSYSPLEMLVPRKATGGWTVDCFLARFSKYEGSMNFWRVDQAFNPIVWLEAELARETRQLAAGVTAVMLPFKGCNLSGNPVPAVVDWELLMNLEWRGPLCMRYPQPYVEPSISARVSLPLPAPQATPASPAPSASIQPARKITRRTKPVSRPRKRDRSPYPPKNKVPFKIEKTTPEPLKTSPPAFVASGIKATVNAHKSCNKGDIDNQQTPTQHLSSHNGEGRVPIEMTIFAPPRYKGQKPQVNNEYCPPSPTIASSEGEEESSPGSASDVSKGEESDMEVFFKATPSPAIAYDDIFGPPLVRNPVPISTVPTTPVPVQEAAVENGDSLEVLPSIEPRTPIPKQDFQILEEGPKTPLVDVKMEPDLWATPVQMFA